MLVDRQRLRLLPCLTKQQHIRHEFLRVRLSDAWQAQGGGMVVDGNAVVRQRRSDVAAMLTVSGQAVLGA